MSLALTSAAGAAPTPEKKCWAGKSKVAGKFYLCLQNASAKYATSGDQAKFDDAFTKCSEKYFEGWEKQEMKAAKAGATCFDGDVQDVAFYNFIGLNWEAVQKTLSGFTSTLPVCGNGTVETGYEQCDGSDLGGETCASEGFAGGTLRCASGCTLDTSGCYATRFVDNGNGTVTDNQTRLVWEKKTTAVGSGANSADPHDVDNTYTWGSQTAPYPPNGTAFTDFIGRLNGCADGICFTGKCDWRLPTLEELVSIVDFAAPGCEVGSSCISGVFGPTVPSSYWSSSTYAGPFAAASQAVEGVRFDSGDPWGIVKLANSYVRAVRGGS